MAQSAYCKNCRREVLPGTRCPLCGGKLSGQHLLWRSSRLPVADWGCWNAPMRLALPTLLLGAAALAVCEGLFGGWAAVRRLLQGETPRVFGLIALAVLAAAFLLLLLQGRETLEMTADKSGVCVRRLLAKPNAVKLLARFRSPRLAAREDLRMEYGLLVGEDRLAWKDVRRVALWPEKGLVLLYAPAWWLRLALPVSGEAWEELLPLLREKLGRRKDATVPPVLRPEKKAGGQSARREKAAVRQAAPPAEADEEAFLQEIAAMNAELDAAEQTTL